MKINENVAQTCEVLSSGIQKWTWNISYPLINCVLDSSAYQLLHHTCLILANISYKKLCIYKKGYKMVVLLLRRLHPLPSTRKPLKHCPHCHPQNVPMCCGQQLTQKLGITPKDSELEPITQQLTQNWE